MKDEDILTLCCFEEANLEPDDGVAAIARVVLNRMRLHYASDGTVPGTVFHHDQFSWAEWTMVQGKYKEVALTPEAVQMRAEYLLARDEAYRDRWARTKAIVEKVQEGTYHGQAYEALTDETVLYLNPEISHEEWAKDENFITTIGHHNFYKA